MVTLRGRSLIALPTALIAALLAMLALAPASSAAPKARVAGPMVLEAANGEGECLAHIGVRSVALGACNGAGTLFHATPWNDHGMFTLRNAQSGLCLDFGPGARGAVFQSPCSSQDSGQIFSYHCTYGTLMAAGPTTRLTWYHANNVNATSSGVEEAKQRWIVHPHDRVC